MEDSGQTAAVVRIDGIPAALLGIADRTRPAAVARITAVTPGDDPTEIIWVTLPCMTVTQKVQSPGTVAGTGRAGRWRALAALALSGLVIGLDSAMLNVALLGATAS